MPSEDEVKKLVKEINDAWKQKDMATVMRVYEIFHPPNHFEEKEKCLVDLKQRIENETGETRAVLQQMYDRLYISLEALKTAW